MNLDETDNNVTDDQTDDSENSLGPIDLDDVVDILESEPMGNIGFSKEIEDAIITDPDGSQWVTLKTAVNITSLSYSTLNRYTKQKKIASRKSKLPTGGDITLVNLKEITELRDEKELSRSEKEVKATDFQLSYTKVMQNAVEPGLKEIQMYLEKIESYQLQIITEMKDNDAASKKAIGELTEKNESLEQTMHELRDIISQQSEKIDQQLELINKLQEAQETSLALKPKKKGFFSFFSKKDD